MEEESLKRRIDSDNIIEAMVFDGPNPEELGKEYGFEVYKKLWGNSYFKLSSAMYQKFKGDSFHRVY